jgi:hypothetical protein
MERERRNSPVAFAGLRIRSIDPQARPQRADKPRQETCGTRDYKPFIALFCAAVEEKLPSADHVRVIKEAEQRERSRAMRAVPQLRRRLPVERPAPTLSDQERTELRHAVERFVRERPGDIVDLWKVQP